MEGAQHIWSAHLHTGWECLCTSHGDGPFEELCWGGSVSPACQCIVCLLIQMNLCDWSLVTWQHCVSSQHRAPSALPPPYPFMVWLRPGSCQEAQVTRTMEQGEKQLYYFPCGAADWRLRLSQHWVAFCLHSGMQFMKKITHLNSMWPETWTILSLLLPPSSFCLKGIWWYCWLLLMLHSRV